MKRARTQSVEAARVRPIYTNGRARRVEWTRIGCIAAGIGLLWWGWTLTQTYGLNPGDGGVLRSAQERFLVGGAVAAMGVLLIAAIQIYCSRYVLHIERAEQSVVITTLGALGKRSRSHPLDAFVRSSSHNGDRIPFQRVNAPWMSLSVAGLRIPYLIDAQSKGFDRSRIQALIRRR